MKQGEQRRHCAVVLLVLVTLTLGALAQTGGGGRNRGQQGGGCGKGGGSRQQPLPADMGPLAALSVVPGRPTDRAITLNVLAGSTLEGFVEFGPGPGNYGAKTAVTTFAANTPTELKLVDLQPDTGYAYRLRTRQTGEHGFALGAEHCFHTARPAGRTFTFELQGDSHPERPQMFDASLYERTLRAVEADQPDFFLTLGDDFSVDTLQTVTADAVARIYRYQRLFLSLVNAPVFLVNGNHEQAARVNLDGTPNNVAVWAGTSRNKYFSLPAPDSFYSGDAQPLEHVGLLRDYYAWTWGDALFVVIDPYWHSPQAADNVIGGREKTKDKWDISLGDTQYHWLAQTLQQSRAKYKFVFAHHVLGTGRGGIENAGLFEWGGKDKRGVAEFARRRPGWELPIHQLMVKSGVTIFFQGHDHIFVKQQLDGLVYQSLPLPADPYYAFYNRDAYVTGDALPGSGRVRVTVSPTKVSVEYVRSLLPQDETAVHHHGEIGYRYEVLPAR